MTAIPPFSASYAGDDDALIKAMIRRISSLDIDDAEIDRQVRGMVSAIRDDSNASIGGVEDFMREYGLSTREGLALMVMAEALLRVPDSETQERLIEDKLKEGGWQDHKSHGDSWLVASSAWALATASRVIKPGEMPDSILRGLAQRIGMPSMRVVTRQAMRFLGRQFVLGENMKNALDRARKNEAAGYRHSFDMLGEGARTREDAKRYFKSYADAIDALGKYMKKSGNDRKLPDRIGISVKLSAIHPHYLATHRDEVMREVVPDLLKLAQMAKEHELNFTVDAEEADRLELSLDVIEAVFSDPSLEGWDGFGLAIQGYQKRAGAVVDYIDDLCARLNRRMMVRLVKGAYWDTEIKRAQERGLDDYPVWTRKPATDVAYLDVAKKLLDKRPRLYPQFATHNALTIASVLAIAGEDRTGFEMQRLHGMGETLYDYLHKQNNSVPCRIYAPVGGYRDLLAYLVRRLLENGANSSFVSMVGDKKVPVEHLLERPQTKLKLDEGHSARNRNIPLPSAIYSDRRNSAGIEFGDRDSLAKLVRDMDKNKAAVDAVPLMPGLKADGDKKPVMSPSDPDQQVGTIIWAEASAVQPAFDVAKKGFAEWSRRPVEERALALEKAADLMEEHHARLMRLLSDEAGKTLDDGLAEIREAVDFCRYYAIQARKMFAGPMAMPGPTGEDDSYRWRGRGVFTCISPWNFPLAIFMGQITAALVSGNAVIAKPAPQTPLIAFEAIKLLHQAGVPENALLFLPGGPELGAAITEHPDLGGVAFTGSTATARAINRTLAAKDGPITPLIAETGGLNAMIVDATALPEQVADDVVMSAFRSAGQRCSALRILYVQQDIADRMIDMIEGAAMELNMADPSKPDTDMGPVIDKKQWQMLADHVADMKQNQKLRYAGKAPEKGTFFAPHIVELDKPGSLTKEVFGPILHIVRYKAGELDKVCDQISATGYGLTLGIHSRISGTAERVVRRMDTGNIYVNRNMIGAVVGTQPFGGSGLSGTGFKAGGPAYLLRFALEQVVSVNTAAAGGNASLIAIDDD
ncbi:bifunctional proline dehydrogenase/L-glutamate gamma-semialdehyde dehydrogenase PutA [Martelella mediterranea]|uniref:Bifunctional protein PutA n=1 Tax=Martelella mediterranea TaxID=293089 RepID=A0A4R3NI04_9HYPH|nr:bifunctional proline dehydrogenase/L-glutamate gamma-semialdehyde dehydrogenase PutA [Martelella mediterranea]TCT31755.1 L-proline dehydrogenase /delta-1-pyrroline-5-carboxylate dehydrogenase [Martelella mediterranea]